MVARVKKNDTVEIVSGRDKGEQGVVIEISPKQDKVMVKGLGLITRHMKPRKQGDVGGIKKVESYFKMSQVMPVCSSCKKPSRTRVKQAGNGKNVRACHRCEEIM